MSSEKEIEKIEEIDLESFLNEIAEKNIESGQFKECYRVGIFLFCKPCPFHQDNPYDLLYLNTEKGIWRCSKDPRLETGDYEISIESLKNALKKAKARDVESAKCEVVEHYYLSNNLIKSVNTEKGYIVFRYEENLGYYIPQSNDTLKSELQYTYEKLWGQKPQLYLLTEMRNKICTLTEAGKDLSVFDHDHREYYYIPFKKSDILVNRKTGEIRIVQKDPVNRPFLTALPYNFDSLNVLEPMPKELEELLSLVPPGFRETLLMEIVSPLAFMGSRKIFINFSRVGSTGKTTLLRRLSELYPGLVAWTEAENLDSRFEKSMLIGKSAILIDEFEGTKSSTKRQLKNLASDNNLRIEFKNGPIINIPNKLSVIINSNTLRFDNFDMALLQRLIVIPFIRNFNENDKPEPWSEEVKEKILKWLITYALHIYYKKEPKKYPLESLKLWVERAKEGDSPIDGVEDFLYMYFMKEYRGLERNGKLVSLEEAYGYYLVWAERVEYIPLSYAEFIEKVKFISSRDKGWLTEDNKLYMKLKNSGLDFFL